MSSDRRGEGNRLRLFFLLCVRPSGGRQTALEFQQGDLKLQREFLTPRRLALLQHVEPFDHDFPDLSGLKLAERAGADAFLRKPNDLIELVETIRRLLADGNDER